MYCMSAAVGVHGAPTAYFWLMFSPWRTPFGAGHAGFAI